MLQRRSGKLRNMRPHGQSIFPCRFKHPQRILFAERPSVAEDIHELRQFAFGGLRNHLLADQLKLDRKSTRLNSSHVAISYAVFCLKKKKKKKNIKQKKKLQKN